MALALCAAWDGFGWPDVRAVTVESSGEPFWGQRPLSRPGHFDIPGMCQKRDSVQTVGFLLVSLKKHFFSSVPKLVLRRIMITCLSRFAWALRAGDAHSPPKECQSMFTSHGEFRSHESFDKYPAGVESPEETRSIGVVLLQTAALGLS